MAERKTSPQDRSDDKKKTGATEIEDGALDQASGGAAATTTTQISDGAHKETIEVLSIRNR